MGRSGVFIWVNSVSEKLDGFLLWVVMTVHAKIRRTIPDLVGVGANQSWTNVYDKSIQTQRKCQSPLVGYYSCIKTKFM
jgi:hypothetical protein